MEGTLAACQGTLAACPGTLAAREETLAAWQGTLAAYQGTLCSSLTTRTATGLQEDIKNGCVVCIIFEDSEDAWMLFGNRDF